MWENLSSWVFRPLHSAKVCHFTNFAGTLVNMRYRNKNAITAILALVKGGADISLCVNGGIRPSPTSKSFFVLSLDRMES